MSDNSLLDDLRELEADCEKDRPREYGDGSWSAWAADVARRALDALSASPAETGLSAEHPYDAVWRDMWRSVNGPLSELNGPLICFAAKVQTATRAETGRASETSGDARLLNALAMLRMLHMECLDEGHIDSGEMGDACRHRGMVIRCGICSTLDDVKKVLDAIPSPPPSASSATTEQT